MAVTPQLCDRIAGISYENLGAPAIEAARRLVLDGIAVAIAGTQEEAIHILAAHHREQGGAAQATAIGNGFRLNAVSAAALNGAAMHVLDFEPMWSPANHALSTTLAGVLALAETREANGREVVTALVKGLEMQGWIRQASGQFEASRLRFHPPGAAGPLGAAVAAGHLLNLGPDRLAHAIGIAASRAGGLMANAGTMTKSTHCGHAAALGLESALLAARGFTANVAVFEAAQGYVPALYDDGFKPEVMLGFGRAPLRVVDPGFAIKMFPSQFGTHFGITAALELHPEIPDASAIRRVLLTAPVMAYVDRPRPKTGLEGKFSLQYTAASALLDGKVGIGTFTDARLESADMQELLAKFEVRLDPSIPGRFEDTHVLLRLELDGGRVLETRCDGPRGKWGTPPISEAEHLVKVRDCLATRLEPDAVEAVIGLARQIDTLDAAGVRQLMQLAGCFA
ncbi:MAG TPA: MmgE/PrpD family protein [Bradyrhizobium sp.]|jgi:2-methylcitrate dehydratase PrpD|uniref:MmgE/PrpD family protein n=1 Tax=Bradyrhizobium sp. TaxID=376 RepID=UPI002C8E81A6|nr:MmgE/PrpD family protein [Bradyrhizobium sp.]HTB01871.1 MmgE/PrpD family protein [Bradyrhizobium sp.]